MESLALETILMLLAAATVAGFVDAAAGGGGLIALPALLSAGLDPAAALATNKLQGSFGTFSSTRHFVKNGHVELRKMHRAIICTFIGAALGTILVQLINPDFLVDVIPFLLIGSALYFLFSPRISDDRHPPRMAESTFALVFGTGIGFYDGFFGPGTGSFFVLAMTSLLGHPLRLATGETKVLNFTSNIASLLFFLLGGKIVWTVGLIMACGQFTGAKLGSRMVIAKGARFIKPLLVVMSLAMTAKLLLA